MLKLKQPNPDLDAPLAPGLPASDERFNFRPLTEEEKKEFMDSLNDNGRQTLADLEITAQTCSSATKDHKGGNQLGCSPDQPSDCDN